MREWEVNRNWYKVSNAQQQSRFFVLVHDGESDSYSYREADVRRALGEPIDKHEIGSYIINVYNADMREFRSLSIP
jgi:hypothetical protein